MLPFFFLSLGYTDGSGAWKQKKVEQNKRIKISSDWLSWPLDKKKIEAKKK